MRHAAPQTVHDQMESCSRCRGIRVHDPVETLFTIAWNTQLEALEALRGFEPGRIRLIAQIESVDALPRLDEIARSSSRLLGMILGSEDFSVTAGMEPIPEALFAPNQQIVFACRRAGNLPFGFPASIADYSDLNSLRCHIRLARRMGFCRRVLHPSVSSRPPERGIYSVYHGS
jgi:citrate lyase beta subunit